MRRFIFSCGLFLGHRPLGIPWQNPVIRTKHLMNARRAWDARRLPLIVCREFFKATASTSSASAPCARFQHIWWGARAFHAADNFGREQCSACSSSLIITTAARYRNKWNHSLPISIRNTPTTDKCRFKWLPAITKANMRTWLFDANGTGNAL